MLWWCAGIRAFARFNAPQQLYKVINFYTMKETGITDRTLQRATVYFFLNHEHEIRTLNLCIQWGDYRIPELRPEDIRRMAIRTRDLYEIYS